MVVFADTTTEVLVAGACTGARTGAVPVPGCKGGAMPE